MNLTDRLKRTRLNLIMDAPFFGTLAFKLDATPDASVPSAMTDGKVIKINPEFAAKLTDSQLAERRKIVADARKSLALPTINAPGLEDYAGQIAQQIEDLYRSTIRTIEVESLLHNRDRAEEDDEDILLLIA